MSQHERRFDPKRLDKLESPDRAEQFPVDAILDAAGVCGLLNVADIGAGTGYFTLPIASRVGSGQVWAVDPSPDLLEFLRGKLSVPGSPVNIELIQGEDRATHLPDASCDLIFLSAVWHELDDRPAALAEFRRIAAPNAKLAIVDWSPEGLCPPGPPLAHRVPLAEVESLLEEHGWGVVKSNPIGPAVYLVVAQRS